MMLSKMLCRSLKTRLRAPAAALVSVGLSAALAACAGSTKSPSQAPDPGAQATRVSASFVRCVELSGADCVHNPPQMQAWDAVTLLGWIYEASPVSVLGALNTELAAHAELDAVQKRFVKATQTVRGPLQGAGCKGGRVYPVKEVLGRLVPAVQGRLRELGILDGSMQEVIQALANEGAQGIGDGHIVQMQCSHDASLRLYTFVAKVDGKLTVVGMNTELSPLILGHEEPSVPDNALNRRPKLFAQGPESYVHPWVDLDWELY